jgi:hypothetical protein
VDKPEVNRCTQLLGDIPLFLAERNKAVDHGPTRISLGAVKLYAWQVHTLAPVPASFPGSNAYLIKVNYEFQFEPGVPAPARAEVGFRFDTRKVIVNDALPRDVAHYQPAGLYQLTARLEFTLANGNGPVLGALSEQDPVALPAIVPQIHCYGIGGDEIRWQHRCSDQYPIPPGTRSGWLVLVVPEKCRTVRVVAMGDCDLGAATPPGLAPNARPDAFTVRLPAAQSPIPAARPQPAQHSQNDHSDQSLAPRASRVFISYAQESPEHKAAVQQLCALLRTAGIDVRYDQDHPETRRSWTDWTNIQIGNADYVLVVASPMYRAASDGELDSSVHRGVRSEYDRLTDELHRDRATWLKKILPVVLPNRSQDEIPRSFAPYTHDYYQITDLTEAGAAQLLLVLRAPRGSAPKPATT